MLYAIYVWQSQSVLKEMLNYWMDLWLTNRCYEANIYFQNCFLFPSQFGELRFQHQKVATDEVYDTFVPLMTGLSEKPFLVMFIKDC